MKRSAISRQTLEAYRRALYRVCGVPPWDLRVGGVSPELAAAQAQRGVTCSAFITACNPRGHRASAEANAERQRALRREIERQGLDLLEGTGGDPAGRWPDEPSFLVFGLPRDAAQALGRRFEQNAILWSGPDATPQLILLR